MIDYKNGETMGKIMKKIVDLRLRYYVDADGVVQTFWQGSWAAWHEVAEIDPRMVV